MVLTKFGSMYQKINHSCTCSTLLRTAGYRLLREDYQANPITLGRRGGEKEEPTGLVSLTVEYFEPNGEPIPERKQTLFWNDRTGEKDGYGMARHCLQNPSRS